MVSRTVAELREAAAEAVAGAELEQVVLHSAHMTTSVRGIEPPYEIDVKLQVRADQVENGIESWSRYEVCAAHDDAGDELVWRVILECYALFSGLEDARTLSEEQLSAFALIVGAPTLHPFARDYVQSLTSKSAFPAFTMGLLTPISGLADDETLELSEPSE